MPSPEEPDKLDDTVPDPELSPTTNPILAQNLGLWAQVYYTTPPEQREQAVQKLLEELKAAARVETVSPGSIQPPSPNETAAATPRAESVAEAAQPPSASPQQTIAPDPQPEVKKPVEAATAPSSQEQAAPVSDNALVCPACLHRNRPQQRFCGLCGFPLKSSAAESAQAAAARSKAAVPPPPPPRQIERSEESWDWLREKSTPGFDTSSEHSGTWKYIALVAGGLVLLLLASIWWVGSRGAPSSAQAPAEQQTLPAAPSEPSQPASARPSGPAASQPEPPVSGKTTPATGGEESAGTAPAPTVSPTGADDDDGTAELIQARRYLDGNGVPRDSMAASHWLWKSVAKKNTQAVLLLSDLYARGDGVSKSCDQARVLLQAAAERGSTEASAKLVNLRQTICP